MIERLYAELILIMKPDSPKPKCFLKLLCRTHKEPINSDSLTSFSERERERNWTTQTKKVKLYLYSFKILRKAVPINSVSVTSFSY